MTTPAPPPEGVLIAEARLRPPKRSIRACAAAAEMSESRWRQLEKGIRMFRGVPYPETGPADTIARMARVVHITPQQLADAGRPDAAGELEALLIIAGPYLTKKQNRALDRLMKQQGKDRGDNDGFHFAR